MPTQSELIKKDAPNCVDRRAAIKKDIEQTKEWFRQQNEPMIAVIEAFARLRLENLYHFTGDPSKKGNEGFFIPDLAKFMHGGELTYQSGLFGTDEWSTIMVPESEIGPALERMRNPKDKVVNQYLTDAFYHYQGPIAALYYEPLYGVMRLYQKDLGSRVYSDSPFVSQGAYLLCSGKAERGAKLRFNFYTNGDMSARYGFYYNGGFRSLSPEYLSLPYKGKTVADFRKEVIKGLSETIPESDFG